jgi:hypothetical protein
MPDLPSAADAGAPDPSAPAEAVARELSDEVWDRILARDPVAALRDGRGVAALPRGGPGELAENVSFAATSRPPSCAPRTTSTGT